MKFFLLFAALLASFAANAESIYRSMTNPWATYVFVSTDVPESTLIALARQAAVVHAVIVLRGFAAGQTDWKQNQKWIGQINDACCASKPPVWQIYPQLFDQYHIKAVPAIAIAKAGGSLPQDYAVVTGDIGFGEALKIFAQRSKYTDIRNRAIALYGMFHGQ